MLEIIHYKEKKKNSKNWIEMVKRMLKRDNQQNIIFGKVSEEEAKLLGYLALDLNLRAQIVHPTPMFYILHA